MRYEKYGFRNWAVYDNNNELVCITVYKKGALEVIRRLDSAGTGNITLKQNTADVKLLLKEIKAASAKIQKMTKELIPQLET